jgi:hypothetical protein
MIRVALSVAEKPSVAKELATVLSNGRAQRVLCTRESVHV